MGRNCTNFPQGLYFSFDSFARILKLVTPLVHICICHNHGMYMRAYQCSFGAPGVQIYKCTLYKGAPYRP
ncbi:unnamed protein product [Ixodes persulcatus]